MELSKIRKLLQVTAVLLIVLLPTILLATDAPKWIGAFFVKGKVGLKWQSVEGVSDYAVYRKSSTEDYSQISTTDKSQYFDTQLSPGAIYTYKIAAVVGGVETFSGEKTVTIPGSQGGEFNPPKWVGIRIDQDRIFLNWDNVGSSIAYNIYRSTTSGTDYEVIGTAEKSSYVDKGNLEKGTTYYYALSAMNEDFEETEFSDERSIKFGMSLAEQEAAMAAENKIELEDVSLTLLFDIEDAGSLGALNQPADIFVNSVGDIYITDALNGKVHCFGKTGKYNFSFGEKTPGGESDDPQPGSFGLPFTLFIDKSDQVYVTDIKNNDIQIFSRDGDFVKRIKVDVGADYKELRPNGIFVMDDGRIVVTDTGNHRFLIIDQNGKILLSKGSRGDKEGEFNFPDELVVTKDNTICIVDGINCRVQQFDLEGTFKGTFGSIGQSAGTFARPKGITIDENGRIFVSDAMSNMVQGFDPDGNVKIALGVTEDVRFITPRGIFFKDGQVYVVNRAINKISVYKIG